MEIGERVRYFRKKHGWTQVQLSQKAGVKQATISAIESGRNFPQTPTIELIAKALDVKVSEIMGEEQENELTRMEEKLLFIFQQLNKDGQALLLKQAESILETPSMRKEGSMSSMG